MMLVGLAHLRSGYVGEPFPCASFTVPCPAFQAWDLSGFEPGLRCDRKYARLYFTGLHNPAFVAQGADSWASHGADILAGNEPDNDAVEGYHTTPAGFADWFEQVAIKSHANLWYPGPSGRDRNLDWLRDPRVQEVIKQYSVGVALHVYGTRAEVRAYLRLVRSVLPDTPLGVSELNPGWGRPIAEYGGLRAWCQNDLPGILDDLKEAGVVWTTYFAQSWKQDDATVGEVENLSAEREPLVGATLRSWANGVLRGPVLEPLWEASNGADDQRPVPGVGGNQDAGAGAGVRVPATDAGADTGAGGQEAGVGDTDSPARGEATMKLGLMYRMGSDIPETTVDQIADLCDRGGFTVISPKANEAEAWMAGPARWQDHDPVLGIDSGVKLAALRDAFGTRGIELHPWAVYRGMDWEAEAAAHAETANICRVLVVDFEWQYPGFADHGSWADAVAYFQRLRSLTAGKARIVFCPDPRQLRDGAYSFAEIAPYVDVLSDQDYWTDFQRAEKAVLDEDKTNDHAGKDWSPCVPGNSTPEDLDACLTDVENEWHSATPPVIYVFQRVGLRDENLAVLKKHSLLGGLDTGASALAGESAVTLAPDLTPWKPAEVPPAIWQAFDALWIHADGDAEKQKAIVATKVAFGLQEAA